MPRPYATLTEDALDRALALVAQGVPLRQISPTNPTYLSIRLRASRPAYKRLQYKGIKARLNRYMADINLASRRHVRREIGYLRRDHPERPGRDWPTFRRALLRAWQRGYQPFLEPWYERRRGGRPRKVARSYS